MIKFKFPSSDTPGYLLRQKQYLEFINALDASPESIDRVTDYLVSFVEEPADKEQAKQELLNLSKSEYEAALAALREEAQAPPQK